MPNFVEESENQTVPSEAMAALLQNFIGVPATRSVTASTAPLAVSTRSRPRWASQTSSRPSRSISSPSGPPGGVRDPVDLLPSWADPEDRAVLGAGEDRALVRPGEADDDVLGAVAGDGDDGEALGALIG